jgi:hypothetical protein
MRLATQPRRLCHPGTAHSIGTAQAKTWNEQVILLAVLVQYNGRMRLRRLDGVRTLKVSRASRDLH